MKEFMIDRKCDITVDDIISFSKGGTIKIDNTIFLDLKKARQVYLREAKSRKVYGYCTGLGQLFMQGGSCPPNWEKIILEEHSTSVGASIASRELVRAFLLTRIIQLTRAPAPVRPKVLERLVDALNHEFIPVIKANGSVGASGDLAPSAEAFRCLFYGKGKAYHGDNIVDCKEVLTKNNFKVLELEPGEALALINNTAYSTGACILLAGYMERLIEYFVRLVSSIIGYLPLNPEHFAPEVLDAKNCPFGKTIAETLHSSTKIRHDYILQAPYSLRCIPQILGTVKSLVEYSKELLLRELCSSSENPVVINNKIYHECNFHSIRAGVACDILALASAHLANLIDRITAQLLRKEINNQSEFLAGENSSVGLMIVQYTTAALSAKIRGLATSYSVHSVPTSGLQEDLVPMTPNSAMRMDHIIDSLIGELAALRTVINAILNARSGPFINVKLELDEAYSNIVAEIGYRKLFLSQ